MKDYLAKWFETTIIKETVDYKKKAMIGYWYDTTRLKTRKLSELVELYNNSAYSVVGLQADLRNFKAMKKSLRDPLDELVLVDHTGISCDILLVTKETVYPQLWKFLRSKL